MSNILTNNINPRSGNLITIGGTNDRVSIAGTLTYEDVSNIDSVGIITARDGLDTPTNLVLRTGGSEKARIDSSGRMLMGTSVSPTTGNGNLSRLVVQGNTSSNSGGAFLSLQRGEDAADISANAGLGLINFGDNAGNAYAYIQGFADSTGGSGDYPGRLAFFTTPNGASTPTERMRIDNEGRLLIGSGDNIRVARGGVGALVQIASNTNSAGVTIRRATDSAFGGYLGFGKARGTLESPAAVQDDDELGTISWGAYDGTDYAAYAASITCSIDGTPGVDDLPGQIVFATTADGDDASTDRLRINKSGTSSFKAGQATQVRFGTTDGVSFNNAENTTILYGNGASNYVLTRACNTADGTPVFDSYVGGSRRIEIEADGDVYNVNLVYGQISDIKLKENIIDSGSQWDDIKALRVRKFNFKAELGYGTKTQIGFIAQEVEEVSPGLVKTKRDEDIDGNDLGTETKLLRMSVIHVKAVKALQEAMTRIETLEQRLTDAGL